MAKVEISESLQEEILKKFKGEAEEIFEQMRSLEDNPSKGKPIGQVGGVLIKELKHGSFRFYFITDGYKLRLLERGKLVGLLIRFVRMSDKKDQQKVIEEIRKVLLNLGPEGFG